MACMQTTFLMEMVFEDEIDFEAVSSLRENQHEPWYGLQLNAIHHPCHSSYILLLLHALNILAGACIDTNLITRIHEKGDIDYGPSLQCRGLGNIVCCVTAYPRFGALYRQFQEIW